MKKVILQIYFFITCCFGMEISSIGQSMGRVEPGFSVGVRNSGIVVNYRISRNFLTYISENFIRFGNIASTGGLKLFLHKKFYDASADRKSLLIGIGYSYISSSKYNEEDSRTDVNSFRVPSNTYWLTEIGYKYIFRSDDKITNPKSAISAGITFSVQYHHGLDKDYSAFITSGTDVEGQAARITRFMKGGLGLGFSFTLIYRKRKSKV